MKSAKLDSSRVIVLDRDISPTGVDMSILSIHKVLNGESWVNVYHLQAAYDSEAGATQAMGLVTMERSLYLPNVLITHYNLSDNIEDTDAYYSVPLNLLGTSAATGDPAPLHNTVRVDFSKLGGGRPGRKYYRGVLTESHIGPWGQILSGNITSWQNTIQAVMDANTAGGENFTYVSATVHPFVAMRQLRRGSKKKSTPSPAIPA